MKTAKSSFPSEVQITLPGPTRRRDLVHYRFQLIHLDSKPGCSLLWIVWGGRMPYQIALEQTEVGTMKWHCTCADAVYRSQIQGYHCKHIKALTALI